MRVLTPSCSLKNGAKLNLEVALENFKNLIYKGKQTMCQGVIGLVNPTTQEFHWGVGSHTSLIASLWPNATAKAGDGFVRFEAQLAAGPGAFSIEGVTPDEDTKALIKDKLLKKAGTLDLLFAYIEEHGAFDESFFNIFITNYTPSDWGLWNNKEVMEAHRACQSIIDWKNASNTTILAKITETESRNIEKAINEEKTALFTKIGKEITMLVTASNIGNMVDYEALKGRLAQFDVRIEQINKNFEQIKASKIQILKNSISTTDVNDKRANGDTESNALRAKYAVAVVTWLRNFLKNAEGQNTLRKVWKDTIASPAKAKK